MGRSERGGKSWNKDGAGIPFRRPAGAQRICRPGVLDEFRGFDRFFAAADAPNRRQTADILGYRCWELFDEDISTRRAPPLEMAELQHAPKHLRTGQSANGDVVVLRMIKIFVIACQAIGRLQQDVGDR